MSEYSPGTFQFAERIMASRVDEAQRAAASRQLGRQARAQQDVGHGLASTALVWLGHRLATWGTRLQDKYGASSPAAVAPSARGA